MTNIEQNHEITKLITDKINKEDMSEELKQVIQARQLVTFLDLFFDYTEETIQEDE